MKPFLQGKKTSPVAPLKATATVPALAQGAATGPRPAPAHAHGGPQVEVIKEGDKVTRLVIVCSCGERIEVDCLYPAGG